MTAQIQQGLQGFPTPREGVVDWMRGMLWRGMWRFGDLHEVAARQVLDLGKEPAQPALDALRS